MHFLNVFNISKHILTHSKDRLSFYVYVFLERKATLHGSVINSKAKELHNVRDHHLKHFGSSLLKFMIPNSNLDDDLKSSNPVNVLWRQQLYS